MTEKEFEAAHEDINAPVTRESRRARALKAEMSNLLEDVVDLMNEARGEDFDITFAINKNAEGKNEVVSLVITKTW